MHRRMARQALQASGHIDELFYFLICIIKRFQLMIHLECFIDRDIQLLRDHFCDRITKRIRKIHHTPDIADDTARRHRTEGDNLRYTVLAIFPHNIVYDLLSALEAKIHVNIRHGYTLRIQKTLKEQIVPDRIQLCNAERIRNDTAGGRAPPRSYRNTMISGITDKIPHDQEIIDIAHLLNRIELIFQAGLQLFGTVTVALIQTLITELVQVFPRSIWRWHIEAWQLGHAKFDLHMASFCNLMCIFKCLKRIWKQLRHLLRRFYKILSALIAHTIFICQLLAGLDTQKDIMCCHIILVSIMHIVCCDQRNMQLLTHPQKLLIDEPLIRDSVILKLQKIIVLSKNFLIFQRGLTRFLI